MLIFSLPNLFWTPIRHRFYRLSFLLFGILSVCGCLLLQSFESSYHILSKQCIIVILELYRDFSIKNYVGRLKFGDPNYYRICQPPKIAHLTLDSKNTIIKVHNIIMVAHMNLTAIVPGLSTKIRYYSGKLCQLVVIYTSNGSCTAYYKSFEVEKFCGWKG